MIASADPSAADLAVVIARRLAGLLHADVAILEDDGSLLEATIPQAAVPGVPWVLRFAVDLAGRACEVLIGPAESDHAPAPRETEVIVRLVAEEALATNRLVDRDDLRDRFVLEVLHGASREDVDALRTAQMLGLDLLRPRAVLLLDVSNYILTPPSGLQLTGRESKSRAGLLRARRVCASVLRYFGPHADPVIAYFGDGQFALLKDIDLSTTADGARDTGDSWASLATLRASARELRRWIEQDLGAESAIGVGRFHPGIQGLGRSYDDARAALVAGRNLDPSAGIYTPETLGVAAYIALDETARSEIAERLVAPLLGHPVLIETLEGFFAADCLPSAAAERLCIHRNTLGYRLDKIAARTGRDPRRFDDAVQLRLALTLRLLRSDGGKLCDRTTKAALSGQSLAERPMLSRAALS